MSKEIDLKSDAKQVTEQLTEEQEYEAAFDEATKETRPSDEGDGNVPEPPKEDEGKEEEIKEQDNEKASSDSIIIAPEEDKDASNGGDSDSTKTEPNYKDLYEKEVQKTSTWNGRISAANKKTEDALGQVEVLTKRIAELESKLQDTAKDGDKPNLPENATSEDLQQFMEDFPDFVKPIQTIASQMAENIINTKYGDTLSEINSQVINLSKGSEESKIEAHFNTIRSVHNDFDQLKESGALKRWIESQRPLIRSQFEKVAKEGEAQEVIEMIDLYKESIQPKSNNTQNEIVDKTPSKAESLMAVQAQSGGPLKTKTSINKDDFDSAWNEAIKKKS